MTFLWSQDHAAEGIFVSLKLPVLMGKATYVRVIPSLRWPSISSSNPYPAYAFSIPLGLIAATTSLPLFITVGCFDLPQQFFLFHLSLVLTFSTLSILLCTTP